MPVKKARHKVNFTVVLLLTMGAGCYIFAQHASKDQPSSLRPLVPGFGVERDLKPVPDFGLRTTPSQLRITSDDRREAERALRHYDRDQDGMLGREELPRNRTDAFPEYDKNGDGKLSPIEVALWFARRRNENRKQTSFGKRSDGHDTTRSGVARELSDQGERKTVGPKSYRIPPPKDRLPEGLPEWFAQRDADGDGQVMMAEYATAWPDEMVAEFRRFDLNDDGIVTPEECLKATGKGAIRHAEEIVASIPRATNTPSPKQPLRATKISKRKTLFLRAAILAKRRR